jgi:hypothetical protein
MDFPPTQTVLDYASPPPPSRGLRSLLASVARRLAGFIRWIPRPVVAVLLTLPPLALDLAPWKFVWDWRGFYLQSFLFLLALFLPGSIRRLNWRHALTAGLFAAFALGTDSLLVGMTWPRNAFARSLLIRAIEILLIGICEMTVTRQLRRRSLVWITGVALGTGAVVAATSYLIQFSDASVSFHLNQFRSVTIPASMLIMPPLFGALTWMAIPATLAFLNSTKPQKRIGVAVAASVGVVVASYIAFFGFLIYPLAARSLAGHGPWRRIVACGIFTVRGSDADYECIWRAVENSDWKIRLDDPKDRGDWREWLIISLGKSRPGATAQRLSVMLRTRPSRLLSAYAADLIAREKCYEAVPVLLRYALLPQRMQDLKSVDALVKLGVPQAALPSINFWLLNSNGAIELMPDSWLGDDRFWGPGRQAFEDLLKIEAPKTRREAFDLFWQLESSRPTPLPEIQRRDVTRLMHCIKRYWDAWQGDDLPMAIRQPDWENAPMELLEQQVDDCVREMRRLRGQAPAVPSN